MPLKRRRIDLILVERGLISNRQRAQAVIMAGQVRIGGRVVDKPGTPVSEDAEIDIAGEDHPYASRGGVKLEGALKGYGIDVSGCVCLDIGASTGGFTDCLLRSGARRVYAVDVGYGQLAWRLRQDPRVILIERMNIRHMPPAAIPEPVDLITIDVSFISLKIVVPAALRFLAKSGHILALIKPQFEVGKGKVGKGGVVKDPAQHAQVIADLDPYFRSLGLDCSKAIPSPIEGPKGNKEFFMLMKSDAGPARV
jgi:23S rRNA (cytidine1920-2'-O)/16S rRNA (cytidine1409-2'-O)-methyltransferase